jgi:hypothetical protein
VIKLKNQFLLGGICLAIGILIGWLTARLFEISIHRRHRKVVEAKGTSATPDRSFIQRLKGWFDFDLADKMTRRNGSPLGQSAEDKSLAESSRPNDPSTPGPELGVTAFHPFDRASAPAFPRGPKPGTEVVLGTSSSDARFQGVPIQARLIQINSLWRLQILNAEAMNCFVGWFPITSTVFPIGPKARVLRIVSGEKLVSTVDLTPFQSKSAATSVLEVVPHRTAVDDQPNTLVVRHASSGIAVTVRIDHKFSSVPAPVKEMLMKLVESAPEIWVPAAPELSLSVIRDEMAVACLQTLDQFRLHVFLIAGDLDGEFGGWESSIEPSSVSEISPAPLRHEVVNQPGWYRDRLSRSHSYEVRLATKASILELGSGG